jgi:hypothetical protein
LAWNNLSEGDKKGMVVIGNGKVARRKQFIPGEDCCLVSLVVLKKDVHPKLLFFTIYLSTSVNGK